LTKFIIAAELGARNTHLRTKQERRGDMTKSAKTTENSKKARCFSCRSSQLETMERDMVVVINEMPHRRSADASVCRVCKAYSFAPADIDRFHRELSVALLIRSLSSRAANNAELLAFARKNLGVNQVTFARMIRTAPESVSRWENGNMEVPYLVLVAILALLQESLRGDDTIKQAMQSGQ
jgi:hypothetical protein